MAKQASTLCDIVLRRVRDLAGVGHSRAFTIARLSDAQRLVNAALGLVVDSATLTTTPLQAVYSRSGALPNAVRIVGIREAGRELAFIPNLSRLAHLNRAWFRETDVQFHAWTNVGSDLFVIYPTKTIVDSVEVREVRITAALAGETDLLELPDEYCDLVSELTVAILLLKQRELGLCQQTLQRLMPRLGLELSADRLHVVPMAKEPTPQGAAT